MITILWPVTQEKKYFRVFKEYPQKSQIWQSEVSPNQGIPNQVPWLGLVSLFQILDFCGYSLIKVPGFLKKIHFSA